MSEDRSWNNSIGWSLIGTNKVIIWITWKSHHPKDQAHFPSNGHNLSTTILDVQLTYEVQSSSNRITGSNYKIMYFLTSDAKDISNMHLNFQSYWSFLRAMVNLDLHVNMLTPSRVFMRLSLGLEMLTFFKFCFY